MLCVKLCYKYRTQSAAGYYRIVGWRCRVFGLKKMLIKSVTIESIVRITINALKIGGIFINLQLSKLDYYAHS